MGKNDDFDVHLYILQKVKFKFFYRIMTKKFSLILKLKNLKVKKKKNAYSNFTSLINQYTK